MTKTEHWWGALRAQVIGVAALQLALGCAAEVADPAGVPELKVVEDVGVTTEAIRNGWTPDPDEIDRGGFVALVATSSPLDAFCSGTVMTNSHVLTARHCVEPDLDDVGAISIVLGDGIERQLRRADIIWVPRGKPDRDYAWIHVDTPFFMPSPGGANSQTGYVRNVMDVPNNSAAYCFGFGESPRRLTFAQLILSRQDPLYVISPNQFGQTLAPGDSGGGCFGIVRGLRQDLSNAPLVSIARAGAPGLPVFFSVAERAVKANESQVWDQFNR